MDEQEQTYGRRQRRRAIIAWTTAALVVVLVGLGAVFGDEDERERVVEVQPFGFSMSTTQYDDLEEGLEEGEFLNRLEQTGSPEDRPRSR